MIISKQHIFAELKKAMTSFIAVAVVSYLLVVAAMFIFQRNLMFHPGVALSSTAAAGVAEMEEVDTVTDDGLTLRSWYRPAVAGRMTMVLVHGNAGDIGDRGYKVRPYLDAGLGVFLVGYRGFGGNPGNPTEEGLYRDAAAAVAYLRGRGVKPAQMVLYGESLGTGVAVHLARQMAKTQPAGGVILESPYDAIANVGAYHYPYVPVRWLVKDKFDSESKIAHIRAPLLVMHGTEDRVIPVRFGRRLFAAAVEPKKALWIEGATHNTVIETGTVEAVLEFIRSLPQTLLKPKN